MAGDKYCRYLISSTYEVRTVLNAAKTIKWVGYQQ